MGPFAMIGKVNNTIGNTVATIDTLVVGINNAAQPLMEVMVEAAKHTHNVSRVENKKELLELASDLPDATAIAEAEAKLTALLGAL